RYDMSGQMHTPMTTGSMSSYMNGTSSYSSPYSMQSQMAPANSIKTEPGTMPTAATALAASKRSEYNTQDLSRMINMYLPPGEAEHSAQSRMIQSHYHQSAGSEPLGQSTPLTHI